MKLSHSLNDPSDRPCGFTLLELLGVMAVIAIMAALTVPAVLSLNSSGNTNKAASDLSQTLQLARVYAMANSTYVRVALSEIPATDSSGPSVVALTVYSASGSKLGDLTKAMDWPSLGIPLVLTNLKVYDGLNAATPNTTLDVTPKGTNATGTPIDGFVRKVPGRPGELKFTASIQFSPSGEAAVCQDEPARYIKIAIDQPSPGNASEAGKKNPVLLRVSGINGSVTILRAENLHS